MEDISAVEILPSARFMILCLQTKIYVYTRNGMDLHDIINCCRPRIYSAMYNNLEQRACVAYLRSPQGEQIEVNDYSLRYSNNERLKFVITEIFGKGYKVGGI